MTDPTHNGSAAVASPAPASVGGAGAGVAGFTSVVSLPGSDAVVSLPALMHALAHLEALFRTSGEALSATTEPPTSDSSTEHVSGGDGCRTAHASKSPLTAPQVFSTLNVLATAAARCDAEVNQHLTALRCGVSALAQELNTLSERYPSMCAKASWAGMTGRDGSPSSSPGMTLRTPQILASAASAPAGNSTGGAVSALRGSPSGNSSRDVSQSSAPLAHRSAIVTPTSTPQQLPAESSSRPSVGGDAGLRGPCVAVSSATPSPVNPAAPATSTSAVSGHTPSLHAGASPSQAASLDMAQASPLKGFTHIDRAELQLPAAQLPHAACMENVKKYLSHCVEWPPRPREQRRAPPHQDVLGSRARKLGDLSDTGCGGSATFKVEGSPDQSMRLGLSCDSTHRHSDTDEFLRRLTEESPYELSVLRSTPAYSRGSPASSSTRSGDNSNSVSYGSGGDYDLRFDEEERQQQSQVSALPAGDRRTTSRPVLAGSAKRHRSHGPLHTTPVRHTTRRRTCNTKADGPNVELQQPSRRRGRPTLQESVDVLVLGQLRADGIVLPPHMAAELCWCEEDNGDAVSQRADAASGVAADAWCAVPVKSEANQFGVDPSPRGGTCSTSDAEADFAAALQEVRALVRHGQHGSGCRSTSTSAIIGGTVKEPSVGMDDPHFELSQVCAQLSTRLPTTSTWLSEIHDFCSLLDDMAVAVADDACCTVSAEEDRQEGAKAGLTQHSPNPTTSLTRECVSAALRELSSSSTISSLHHPSSNAVAPGSASDFFTPEKKTGGSAVADSSDGQRHGAELTAVRSRVTPAGVVVQASPVSLMASPESSSHCSQSSNAVHSSFREVLPSAGLYREKEGCNSSAPSPAHCCMRATTTLVDVWLGGLDVSGRHLSGSGLTAARAASGIAGAEPHRGSVPFAPALTSTSSGLAESHTFVQKERIRTTVAQPFAGRHSRIRETQHQRRQALLQRQEALLRRRCVRVRADTPPLVMKSFSPSALAASDSAPDDAASSRPRLPSIRRGKVTPVIDYKAVAEHLRALCALLQTDLILVCTLQELSKLVHTTYAPLLTNTTALDGMSAPPTSSTSDSFAAAARLLVSLQQHRKIQTRLAQEASMLCDDGSPAEVGSPSAHSLTSISDPLPPPGCGSGLSSSGDGAGAAPLMLSVLHPMSALGYTPILGSAISTAVRGTLNGNHESASNTLANEGQLARYIVAVAPYLLAWQRGAAESGICNGALQQEVSHRRGCVNHSGGWGASPLAQTSCPATLSKLPLPVWVYLESLTTMLLEEARKLNAMYELYVLVVAEATLQHRRSCAASASGDANVETVGTTTFSLAPVWHGGTDETLMSYVRRRGRAASVAQGTGVLGMAVPLDNGLEKYVTPVSVHLLNSFDQLEGRHLLHSVFQEVQLSDVVARARARREEQSVSPPVAKQPSTSAPGADDGESLERFTLPPGTLSTTPPQGATITRRGVRDAEQRSTLRGGGGGGGGGGEGDADQTTEQRRRGDVDSGTSLQRPGRATARRLINLPGTSETRHAIIEGFVRYLTGGDRRRSSAFSQDANSPSRSGDQRSTAESEGSPRHQRTTSHPSAHHQSGLTLDVPHTSSLLEKMDARLETGASNVILIRSVERLLHTGSLVDALNIGKLLSYRQSELSTRHYFNARAATFTTRHTLPSYNAACVSVVQCRWQPVFQSTMCFCPVTRRRCLDPLVCGALLTCVTLPPQEIICSVPDPSQSSTPTQGLSRGQTDAVTATDANTANRYFPNTIRALRRLERRSESPGLNQQLQTQAPSPRSEAPQQLASVASASTAGTRTVLPWSPRQRHRQEDEQQQQQQQHSRSPALPFPHAALPDPVRMISVSSLFPTVLLREPSTVPDTTTMLRIMSRALASLQEEAALFPSDGEGSERNDQGGHAATARAAAPAPLTNAASQAPRAVTVPLEVPPVTRNLLASPDRTQASLLNPPTLLECGHVVSHKTYLDLRTTARRTNRNTTTAPAGTTIVVCCPYCSKVTAVKDAVTLSYLY
ncbi:hypothetical protein JKF63_04097 [Porcisia hertigi]|uniref:Uncharacterized protein n=1 Tax=Porcisia hertigi TaxID=2761500 RepID=A0A836IB13_9TRYP|nr:hypothetical protein JKF63_04097 [Porcisia hertigi]